MADTNTVLVFHCSPDFAISQQIYAEFTLSACPTKRVDAALGHLVHGGDLATVIQWAKAQRFTFYYGEPWCLASLQSYIGVHLPHAIQLDAAMDMRDIREALSGRCRRRDACDSATATLPCANAMVVLTECAPSWLAKQQCWDDSCCVVVPAPPGSTVCVSVDAGLLAQGGTHVHVALQAEPTAYVRPTPHDKRFARMYVHDSAVYGSQTPPNVFGGVPLACSWIQPPYAWIGAANKPHEVSCIASNKRFLSGHALRHEVARCFPQVHMYGPEYRPLPLETHGKAAALVPYKYAVVIENATECGYWTEKLVDALICGCVVLYWGTADVLSRFDAGSVWLFRTLNELGALLQKCKDPAVFHGTEPARRANFHRAQAYAQYLTALCVNTDILSLVPNLPTTCACC